MQSMDRSTVSVLHLPHTHGCALYTSGDKLYSMPAFLHDYGCCTCLQATDGFFCKHQLLALWVWCFAHSAVSKQYTDTFNALCVKHLGTSFSRPGGCFEDTIEPLTAALSAAFHRCNDVALAGGAATQAECSGEEGEAQAECSGPAHAWEAGEAQAECSAAARAGVFAPQPDSGAAHVGCSAAAHAAGSPETPPLRAEHCPAGSALAVVRSSPASKAMKAGPLPFLKELSAVFHQLLDDDTTQHDVRQIAIPVLNAALKQVKHAMYLGAAGQLRAAVPSFPKPAEPQTVHRHKAAGEKGHKKKKGKRCAASDSLERVPAFEKTNASVQNQARKLPCTLKGRVARAAQLTKARLQPEEAAAENPQSALATGQRLVLQAQLAKRAEFDSALANAAPPMQPLVVDMPLNWGLKRKRTVRQRQPVLGAVLGNSVV